MKSPAKKAAKSAEPGLDAAPKKAARKPVAPKPIVPGQNRGDA